ncbi:sugar ABC transporter permease [uncultured Cohaesibacter sp.]|uniref:carbohydrate ABC transporter permease n=1 Tax=uncultured Cohaesibacter sp. TaxID=1002546 RepID=UPI00292DA43D|nr:sugar ABC transporter permease [uncultured Cohaesibacter sp.]
MSAGSEQSMTLRSRKAYRRAQMLAPVVFLAPAILLLCVFLLYPLIYSFQLSFLDWNGLGSGARFTGLDNWQRLLSDTVFWQSALNNVYLAVFSVLIQLPIAVVLAVVLDEASKGSRLLKILYFIPRY